VSAVDAARRLLQSSPKHPVLSVYLDLDPVQFATPPARQTQIDSLIDEGARQLDGDQELDHEDRKAVRQDLERVKAYLLSDPPAFKGARGLAVFSSGPDELFETVQLTRPVEPRISFGRTPYIEPLVDPTWQRRWCIVLVNRREARLLAGEAGRLSAAGRVADDVRGQSEGGGLSQANYQRGVEEEVDEHLRRVAGVLEQDWRREPFERLALGGISEVVARLEELLSGELRPLLVPERVDVDLSSVTDTQIRAAVAPLVEHDEQRVERAALDRLAAGLGTGSRATGGPEATLEALNDRRVETLLLAPDFGLSGGACAECGRLVSFGIEPDGAAGGAAERGSPLREAIVEAALGQDAEILFVRNYPDLGPHLGIAALLRF
jgi:peptide chain release factor subunit 1